MLCLLVTLWLAAPLLAQAPAPDPFAPDQVLRIEVKLPSQDWKTLRIGHPMRDAKGRVLDSSYPYYRADVTIGGTPIKQVGVRKKGGWGRQCPFGPRSRSSSTSTSTVSSTPASPATSTIPMFYLDSKTGRFPFIPWGADQVFARSVPASVQARGRLCQRLWELPEIRERYRAQMLRLLAGPFDEKRMADELERVQSMLTGLDMGNPQRATQRIEGLRRFLSDKRGNVLKELEAAPDWPRLPVIRPAAAASRPRLEVTGSFVAPWASGGH